MNELSPQRALARLRREREIVGVFIKHGFGFVFDQMETEPRPWWRRFRPRRKEAQPPEDLAAHFRQALEELGPTFVKLGQMLSTRPDVLPPNYIAELSKLHDDVPPVPWEAIRQVLVEEYGREPEEVFASIDPQPLGAASLAQVHAVTLANGEEAVVKIQRPHVRSIIAADVEILTSLAKTAQRTPLGQDTDLPGMAEDFAFVLHNELDYRREAKNADRFRASFADQDYLHIPRVYWEHTTERVLVMEYIRGIKIDDTAALDAAGYDRHKIALLSADMIVKEVLEDGFFHADPHPGNFVVMPGEVIGAMDFGKVGQLSERMRLSLIRLLYVFTQQDVEGIVDAFGHMGVTGTEVDRASLVTDIGRMMSKYYGLPLQDIRMGEVYQDFTPISYRHHLRVPADLWLLANSLSMMEGMGLKLRSRLQYV